MTSPVDALYTTHNLSDEMWSELTDALGPDGALEVVLLTGWYNASSYAVRALRLPLEPGTAPIPA